MQSAASFMTIVYQLPTLIIAVIGLILSLQLFSAHRRKAQLAAGAFAILLVSVILRIGTNFLTVWMMASETGAADVGMAFNMMGFFQTLLTIVMWILILLALFRSE